MGYLPSFQKVALTTNLLAIFTNLSLGSHQSIIMKSSFYDYFHNWCSGTGKIAFILFQIELQINDVRHVVIRLAPEHHL